MIGYKSKMYADAVRNAARTGAYATGVAPGVVGGVVGFMAAPNAESFKTFAYFIGAVPAIPGAVIGTTLLAPLWYLASIMTRGARQYQEASKQNSLASDLDCLSYLTSDELDRFFNNIVSRYEGNYNPVASDKQENHHRRREKRSLLGASPASRQLIDELMKVSHRQTKLRLVKEYLLAGKEGCGELINDGKKLFEIIMSEVKMLVKHFSAQSCQRGTSKITPSSETEPACPLFSISRHKHYTQHIKDPVVVKLKTCTHSSIEEKVVDRDNLKRYAHDIRRRSFDRKQLGVSITDAAIKEALGMSVADQEQQLKDYGFIKILGNKICDVFTGVVRTITELMTSLGIYKAQSDRTVEQSAATSAPAPN